MAVISGVGVRRYYERFGYVTLKDYQARAFWFLDTKRETPMHNRRQLEGRERRERLRRFNSDVTATRAPPRPPVPLFALQLHQCGCLLWMYQVLHMYLEIVLCEKHRASELLSTYVFAPLFCRALNPPLTLSTLHRHARTRARR